MSEPSYRNLNDELHVAYFDAASESMQKAGEEAYKKCIENQQLHVVDEDKSTGLSRVSVDGSWHRRGHASLNGVVTA